MNDIRLTGLIGSHPLGALSAFGLLRVCSEISDLSTARLYWTQEYDWMAILRVPNEIDKIDLLERLVAHQQARTLDIFNWSNDIRVPTEEYRERLEKCAQQTTLHDRLDADFLAAFGSEIIKDGSKDLVKPTAFYMTSGMQKFLDEICKVGDSLQSDTCKKAFEEALFGPWRYQDNEHALGWDPAAERLHALRHCAPSNDRKNRCVRAAVWLAVEALALYPTAPSRAKHITTLATTGFIGKGEKTSFIWPIWTPPIGIDTLRSLIMSSDLVSLKKRGVATVYQSIRYRFGRDYAILRPSVEYI